MSKKDHEYRCNVCNKDYSTYNTLWVHNKKFHNNNVLNVKNGVFNVKINVKNVKINKSLTCDICNTVFNSRGAKSIHKKNVKIILLKLKILNLKNILQHLKIK